MPAFNVGRALGAGYEPKEILRYLAGRGYVSPYEGSDEDIIRQHLAASGKAMLPYSYGPAADLPPAAAPPPLSGLYGIPASIPGSVPQTGEQRQMSPAEIESLFGEQGIQPTLPPMSLMDMAMLAASEDGNHPETLSGLVKKRK